jgi:hypothetical protein
MNCRSPEREMKRSVNNEMSAVGDSRSTRRSFLVTLAIAAAGGLSMFGAAAISSEAALRKASPPNAVSSENPNDAPRYQSGIVSFHMEQPYLDRTGTAIHYRPPRGARSAAPVAYLSEEKFRRQHCYV